MKIIGNTVGTPLPKPDFKQTDPSKGDYIKNKPEIVNPLVGQVLAIKAMDSDGHVTEFESVEAGAGGSVVAGETLPVGSIIEWDGEGAIPEGWIELQGQELSRTEYPDLFELIGTEYGAGDGSTTFNVPTKSSTDALIKVTTDTVLTDSFAGGLKVNSVSGASEQTTYTGKNLVDFNAPTTKNSITNMVFDEDTGTLSFDYDGQWCYAAYSLTHLIGKKIRFVKENVSNSNSESNTTFNAAIVNSEGTTTYIDSNTLMSGWTVPEGYPDMRFRIFGANSSTTRSGSLTATGLMVVLADETDLTYEPYVGGIPAPNPDYPQEINSVELAGVKTCGKNLLTYPYLYTSNIKSGLTWTDNGDGTVEVNGTNELERQNLFNCRTRIEGEATRLILEAGTYIVSGCPKDGAPNKYCIQVGRTLNGSFNAIGYDIGNGIEFTISEPTQIQIQLVVYGIRTVNNLTFKPMIRLASIADDTYEPYQESSVTFSQPITLRGINDVKDRITKQDGVWGVERKWLLDRVSSSLNWNYSETTLRFYASDKRYKKAESMSKVCDGTYKNTHFINATKHATDGEDLSMGYINNSSCGYAYKYLALNGDIDAWKAFLDENEVYTLGLLDTPTFEPLPAADQLALNSLSTFDGTTYITMDSEIEPSIEVEYGTSKVGGYAIKGMLAPEVDNKINELSTRLNTLQTEVNSKAASVHNHAAEDITSGTLPVDRGGTGYTAIEDTTYTTARYRASSLHTEETVPTVNGTIAWTYE